MDSRSINGLQHILLSMKSAHEAQAEAPELNPNRQRKTSVDAHKMGLAFPVRSERQNNFRRLSILLHRCQRFSLLMNGKRKRETDPIAFLIHFATGQ